MVERIDFGPGAYGENYETHERYKGKMYSQMSGSGPTCFYKGGEKIYTLHSGDVGGVHVEGEYDVYELDLRDLDMSISELKEDNKLAEVIELRKKQIKTRKLEIGQKYRIPPGILHQAYGRGILEIEVVSDYIPEKVIESYEIDLPSFLEPKIQEPQLV